MNDELRLTNGEPCLLNVTAKPEALLVCRQSSIINHRSSFIILHSSFFILHSPFPEP